MHEKAQSNKEVINTDLSNSTFQELNKALDFKLGDAAGIDPKVVEMKKNLFKFACAKSTAQLEELNHLLYDGDKPRSWEAFRAKVVESNTKFNENWLQAEWQTANISGHHARNWNKYKEQKHLFPNLKYRTAGDSRVRKEHDKLNGIILPIDDKFWSKYYPPNGWRCRCGVTQTAEPISKDVPTTFKEVRPEFEHNIGKDGQVFNEDTKKGHKYFALAKEVPNWKSRFELAKLEAPYEKVFTSNGPKIEVSIYADENDLKNNIISASKASKKLGLKYKVRAHLNNGWKNPEYFIDDLVGDRYNGDIATGIDAKRKQIKQFIKQYNSNNPKEKLSEDYAIHIDITGVLIDYDIARKINGELKQGNKLKFIVIENEDNIVKILREDSFETITNKVNKIKAKER